MDDTAVLEVHGISKTYRRGLIGGANFQALRNVSFRIQHSQSVGLVGASGAGKSTVVRCVLQLERPDEGSVVFNGTDLTRLKGTELRKRRAGIQVVFQHPISSIDPRYSVRRAVEEPLMLLGVPRSERSRRVDEVLGLVGLERESQRRVLELSGGQAQRAAIARALAPEPQLIVCDEATSSLDVSVQAQILNLLLELREGAGVTLLIISHDVAVVNALTDRVVVMSAGRVVEEGLTAKVLNEPEDPYTVELMEAARHLGHWR